MQFLSVNEMHQLRCKNCNNFLSCGPMLVWREGTTLCGRCASPKHNTAQAYTFEQVIKTIRVPCRYWVRHCKELLYPDEVPLHEQVCIYKNRCEMLCGDVSAVFKMEKSLPHHKEQPKLLNVPRQALEWLLCTKCSLYLSAPGTYVNNQGRPFCFRCITTPAPLEYIRHIDLEILLGFMVFPCIFHMRGCTKRYRFGDPAGHSHEQDCAYSFAAQRPLCQVKTINVNGKQKGVIPTHTGHVFATITPNTIQLFANSGNWKDGQEKLMNNLQDKVGDKMGTNKESIQDAEDLNGQILAVSKLDTNQFRPRLDDVKNSFRRNVPPPLNLKEQPRRNDIEHSDNSIMHRLKDSPNLKEMLYNSESIPISPVFVQQPNSGSYFPHYNSLPRLDSDRNTTSAITTNQKRTSYAQQPSIIENQPQQQIYRNIDIAPPHLRGDKTPNSRPHSNPVPSLGNRTPPQLSMVPSAPRMMSNSEEQQSDEFQAYGLPYGNTNLTHGVQPNVYGKEVTVERVPSVLQYKNIVSELKIKQKIAGRDDGE